MRILICDDEPIYLESLKNHVEQYMTQRGIDHSLEACADPLTVLENGKSYDLAFLDIQMPQADGIALAKELKNRNSRLALFFVTNYDEYQDDAMDLQAFRFFEKPYDIQRLHAGLDKAMEYIDGAYVDVFLTGEGSQQRILVDDILYVTRENRKVLLSTRQGSFHTKETFDVWCDKLPQLFFYPVHKSYLVNLHYVDRYSYCELRLSDGSRIPIAPRRQSAFHKFWFEYLRRR